MEKYIIGMDLGGTNIKAGLFTKNFVRVAENRAHTREKEGPEAVLQCMLRTARQLMEDAGVEQEEIGCMGIGVPGLLDRKAGISVFSPNLTGWENVPVARWFEEHLSIPVFIDNDVRMNLYGEWYFGAGKNKQNVVLLTLGTGLGAGVVMDGHVLYGATGSAGEIGHMNMYRTGRPCKCGSSGCLGRYVSALGLLRTVREKIEGGQPSVLSDWTQRDLKQITAKMVSEAFDLGDPVARNALYETGELLGYGLVNVINLYNPEIIIVGGGMAAAGERLLARTREIVKKHALELSQHACEIVTAFLGDGAGILGAAVFAWKAASRQEEKSEKERWQPSFFC